MHGLWSANIDSRPADCVPCASRMPNPPSASCLTGRVPLIVISLLRVARASLLLLCSTTELQPHSLVPAAEFVAGDPFSRASAVQSPLLPVCTMLFADFAPDAAIRRKQQFRKKPAAAQQADLSVRSVVARGRV